MTTSTPLPARTAAPLLRLAPGDTVAVAREALAAGTAVDLAALGEAGALTVRTDVPAGHKVALRDVAAGEAVRKYGQLIGLASAPIAAGEHVHVHNLAFTASQAGAGSADAGPGGYAVGVDARPTPLVPPAERRTFDGIVRADGRVATRNYIGILTSVNCSATAARRIADTFRWPGALDAYPNVDGVVALTHGTGCGMDALGEGAQLLRRTISGYARHPNFAALLVIGLGCEVNQVAALTSGFDLPPEVPVVAMTIQEIGGTTRTVAAGVERVRELLPVVDAVRRVPVPASELVLGLNCGGSDAWSGVTANPALGVASDLLVAQGGTSVLAETPEVYGAEHLLTRRARDPEVAAKLVRRIRWWEEYTAAHGGSMDNNPSPGNKAGGLTTILEKSLGAVAKGGSAALEAVYEYAEPITAKGFTFMDTPGYDPVSVTGLVAGGANVVCFTTGRGSVFGCKPAPSIKLATNSEVYARMDEDMDVDCGRVLTGEQTVEEAGRELFELILEVASGRRSKSEELGVGDEEFQPWQLGAVM
ncbi:UxaA family hydrolase [Kineococcus radiotolerans]|uniref:Altronate dehydratase n=1 Tax=Kineococcus radiotolerans (strain ATCC BAA-149 / DSM 14245 / SRS30216) TaxID=266940 RepID=A6W5I2_KINRD|nr:altronate dehydratase family protein [Kineococcus radiotolerans]ABS02071.1 Altronate dehydratase [Kineococcus radiotolerans SRS30216 = ATCC BAA-149]